MLPLALPVFVLLFSSASSSSPPSFRVMPTQTSPSPGRPASEHFAAWVRSSSSSGSSTSSSSRSTSSEWTPAPVLQTSSSANSTAIGGCGYFEHLNGWSHSWISLEVSGPVEVKIKRLTAPTAVAKASVRPVSSGATVTVTDDGEAIALVPGEARFALTFDGGLDDVDTGPSYTGPPMHTFSIFASALDPAPPHPSDPDVVAVKPGDALPLPGEVPANSTLLFLPGEHRPPPQPSKPWPVFSLPADVRVHLAHGAILYAAVDTGETPGTQNVSLDGLGILSGEEMRRCPNQTVAGKSGCNTACPINTSPQGITLRVVTQARVAGVTFVDFPNHHLMLNAKPPGGKCTREARVAGTISDVKVLGWRANGDGLHAFGPWKVERLFMRTQDDSMYLSCGKPQPGCNFTTYEKVTTWNDANGASFCFTGNGTTLRDSDVIFARSSETWWDGGRVFSNDREGWSSVNVTVSNVRISDPLPSLNTFQFTGTGTTTSNRFEHVSIAAYSTLRSCPSYAPRGCNCAPAPCSAGPLPDGVPNVLTGSIDGLYFDNVTIAGTSIGAALSQPGFNVTTEGPGAVKNVYVDGKRVVSSS